VIVFITAVGLGYLFGKHNSPDYDNPRKAEGLILRWTFDRVSLSDTTWKINGNMSSPGKVRLHLINATLHFNCGAILEHDLSTGKSLPAKNEEVVYCSAPLTALEAYERGGPFSQGPYPISGVPELIRDALPDILRRSYHVPRHKTSFEDVLLILVGAKEIYNLRGGAMATREYWLSRKSRSLWKRIKDSIQLAAAFFSGFSLGYYWGYDDDPNCDADTFHRLFKEEEFWQRLGVNLRRFYDFELTVDGKGTITDVTSPLRDALNLRDVYLPIRAARLLDCPPVRLRFADALIKRLTANSESAFAYANAPIWVKFWDLLRTFWSYEPFRRRHVEKKYFGGDWWKQDTDGRWKPSSSETFTSAYF
jgi:hypothetical protein